MLDSYARIHRATLRDSGARRKCLSSPSSSSIILALRLFWGVGECVSVRTCIINQMNPIANGSPIK